MFRNVLIYRTDRIGDLIVTCPAIITIKKTIQNSKITIVVSNSNYEYAKGLNIFDNVYEFPRKNIFKKISFLLKLSKEYYDYIFIFDGKERSILSAVLNKSKNKIALTQKAKFYYKLFKIDFFKDSEKDDLNTIFQKMINHAELDKKISDFDFLTNKKDNNFSKNISIRNYLHIHLDEKWFSNIYIKKYTNIAPSYDSFVDFLEALSRKNDILITTGLIDFDLVQQLKNKFFTKMSEKIFFKKGINRSIYLILKPSFNDLESLLRHTNILVACHGSITHASNSFSVKKIDILEQSKILFYKRFNSYLDNYNPIYRTSFYILKNEIFEKIENLNN